MEPAETIRNAVAAVSLLRVQTAASPALLEAVKQIKLFQAQRFRATYADLLASDKAYVIKKLGMNEQEFEAILTAPPKHYSDYPNDEKRLKKIYAIYHKIKGRK